MGVWLSVFLVLSAQHEQQQLELDKLAKPVLVRTFLPKSFRTPWRF